MKKLIPNSLYLLEKKNLKMLAAVDLRQDTSYTMTPPTYPKK